MKLSFSLAKTAAPKRKIEIQNAEPEEPKREVLTVSADAGILVEQSKEDLLRENQKDLTIPVRTVYERPPRSQSPVEHIPHDRLKRMEGRSGIIAGNIKDNVESQSSTDDSKPPMKKHSGSILMQIRAAKEKGLVQDAPEQNSRNFDPEEFGWALLRGMGYDSSKDTSPDSTKKVVGNQGRLGLGVKYLSSDANPQNPTN
jgi:hypothetical protein